MANESYTSKRGHILPISLEAGCTYVRGEGGTLTLVHDLCTAHITEDGEKIGAVEGMVGGGVQINDERDGTVWQLSALDIFKAYNTARAFREYELARGKFEEAKQQ